MTGESLSTAKVQKCSHVWKQVQGATSAKGGAVLVCERCNASMEPNPPIKEANHDERPLLME